MQVIRSIYAPPWEGIRAYLNFIVLYIGRCSFTVIVSEQVCTQMYSIVFTHTKIKQSQTMNKF